VKSGINQRCFLFKEVSAGFPQIHIQPPSFNPLEIFQQAVLKKLTSKINFSPLKKSFLYACSRSARPCYGRPTYAHSYAANTLHMLVMHSHVVNGVVMPVKVVARHQLML
jgi:hypothetical protein